MSAVTQEAVGQRFSPEAMQHARRMTWQAVEAIARAIRPGMRESAAGPLARQLLVEMGMDRLWHPLLIRFGENTLKTFKERSTLDPELGEDDIFFVDLGVVWNGHEGDAGATFVTGADPAMRACADDARAVFDEVADHWRRTGAGGSALYAWAARAAETRGWRLNLDIKGHRVSDFPHAIHKAGTLGDFGRCPAAGLWVLEIQLAHPQRPFGAFYEDLLA